MFNIFKNPFYFFLSAVIIFGNMLTYYLLTTLSDAQISATTSFSSEGFYLLKFFFTPLANLVVALLYYFIAGRMRVYKIIQYSLSVGLLIFSLYSFILIPNASYLQSIFFVDSTSAIFDVFRHWVISSLYLFNSVWPVMTILFFYGYNNERFTFQEAVKIYPGFGIAALLFSHLAIPRILSSLQYLKGVDQSLVFGAICVSVLFAIKLFYIVLRKMESVAKEEVTKELDVKYVLGLGFIVLSIGLIKNISVLTWNYNCRLLEPWNQDYWQYLKSFSSFSQLGLLLAIMILVFLSLYLRQNLATGWKNFCRGGTFITLGIGVALVMFELVGGFFESMAGSTRLNLTYSAVTNVGATYQILITSVLVPSLTCLKELAILPIPKDLRFRAKVFVDFIFWKLGYFLVVIIQEFLLRYVAIPTPIMIFITLAFLGILASRLALIRYVGTKLEMAIQSDPV